MGSNGFVLRGGRPGLQYGLQIQEFEAVVRERRQPLVSLDSALGNARVIDAIRASAGNGGAWMQP